MIRLAVVVVLLIVAFVIGRISAQPYCPTEDSCVVDYRDGRWQISQDVP